MQNVPENRKRQSTRGQRGTARTSAAQQGAKRRRKSAAARRALILSMTCVLSLVLFFVLLFIKSRYVNKPDVQELNTVIDNGTFFDGIRVNGIDIGGLSYEAARAKLLPSVTADMQSINVRIVHGTTLWLLNAADVGAVSTLDQVLREAILLGRSDTKADNEAMLAELKSAGKDFSVGFTCKTATLRESIAKIASHMGAQPTEPYAEADSWASAPTFIYHEGTDGHLLDEEALCSEISARIEAADYGASLTPELVTIKPTHDMNWVKANTQLRAQWQTDFGSSSSLRNANRVGNIQKATTLLNGACVAVGEEFNFNAFIGPRTEAGCSPLAPGIGNGNTYELQSGGGICHVSTTLYNALLCAGEQIEITERYHHSWPSSYADYGLDSTVTGSAESGKSLNFINNTGAPLYIFAVCDQENKLMNIYLYGEPLEPGVTYKTRGEIIETIEPGEPVVTENPAWPTGYEEVTIKGRKGYKAEAYRDKYLNGEFVTGDILYTDSYRAVTSEITRGTGDPSLPKPASAGA